MLKYDVVQYVMKRALTFIELFQQIKESGMKAGVTINPATPVCVLEDVIAVVDMALIMSVDGWFWWTNAFNNELKKCVS